MNLTKRLFPLVLCLALMLCLTACSQEAPATEPTVPPTTTEPLPDPVELYDAAVEAVKSAGSVKVSVSTERTTGVGTEIYNKTSQQHMTWKDYGTDTMIAKVQSTAAIGEMNLRSTELFAEDAVYLTMDGVPFVAESSAEDFVARYPDLIPLDKALYGSVTGEHTDNGVVIHFEDAEALESWAAPEYAILNKASATAKLSADGSLKEYVYTASFRQGGAQVELAMTFTFTLTGVADLSQEIPTELNDYVYIDSPDAIHLLYESLGYLNETTTASSAYTLSFASQAMSSAYASSVTMTASGQGGSGHISNVTETVALQLLKNGQIADSMTSVMVENFADGQYTVSYDGSEPVPDSSITAEQMEIYCSNTLSTCYPYLDEILNASLTDFDGICLLEFDIVTDYSRDMSMQVSEMLTEDPNTLENLATDYKNNGNTCYVAVNTDTGLPTAAGITSTGAHTLDGITYTNNYQMSQTMLLADPGAYATLTGEKTDPVEPAEKASPLFYHVTGADGQEMWLLGTIHLGDERTAFLPQEIYDALDASSALAVEFDDESFMEMISQDASLAQRVAMAYYYLDGTTISAHLDGDLYAKGSDLLKAVGNVSQPDLMKPYLWSQTIDQFYLQQGYGLSSDFGVDFQLMDYARNNEITILDVESGIEQIEMLAGFSDDIQEMLLESSVETSCAEYNLGVEELFEMWCAGDEAALIEYLKDAETEGMTKQELALYEEYNQAMSVSRNETMLEVAKGYLEGGDTVFYAVGLAHLLAENGLVNTLRDAGYTVELVSYGS